MSTGSASDAPYAAHVAAVEVPVGGGGAAAADGGVEAGGGDADIEPLDDRDAEAAVLALIGQLDDAGDRDIDALVIEQRDLQQQRNTVQAQIKKAKRVRKRVLEKRKCCPILTSPGSLLPVRRHAQRLKPKLCIDS